MLLSVFEEELCGLLHVLWLVQKETKVMKIKMNHKDRGIRLLDCKIAAAVMSSAESSALCHP